MPVTIPDPETIANELFSGLTADENFSVDVPDVSGAQYATPGSTGPLFATVTKLANADLTTGDVGGTGTFDVLMAGFKAHLDIEYRANRITGAEYTKAYIALTQTAMGSAVQFLMGRDTAYWQALQIQAQAQLAQVQMVTARVQLETAKAQLQQALFDGVTAKANYALTKMKLATESATFQVASFQLNGILPAQLLLVTEQGESQRAQTQDSRSDGLPVAGSMGKQKDLYAQQITSYQRDSEVKAARIFTDAWITQKTIDEGLVPPTSFANASVETVLTKLKLNNNLN